MIKESVFVHNGVEKNHISIDLEENDILIVNGLVARGKHIGVYDDSIGIYLYRGCTEPILSLFNKDVVININEYLGKEKTVVIDFDFFIREEDI